MKTPYLLGIITALLFGSFAMSGMFVQAGLEDLEIMKVTGNAACVAGSSTGVSNGCIGGYFFDINIPLTPQSIATCPSTHKLIGGGLENFGIDYEDSFSPTLSPIDYEFNQIPDFNSNSWIITESQNFISILQDQGVLSIAFQAYAMCAKINFPMGGMSMIGGELLDLDTMALFIGAIGVNPVITGLVAITMGGVAAQAIWYVNSRRKKISYH